MEKVFNDLEEIIALIKKRREYENCLLIKEKMKENKDINFLIEELKKTQQEYIKTNDKKLYEKITDLEKKLENIPLYETYLENLTKVNEKIEYVKSSLNEYFLKLLN